MPPQLWKQHQYLQYFIFDATIVTDSNSRHEYCSRNNNIVRVVVIKHVINHRNHKSNKAIPQLGVNCFMLIPMEFHFEQRGEWQFLKGVIRDSDEHICALHGCEGISDPIFFRALKGSHSSFLDLDICISHFLKCNNEQKTFEDSKLYPLGVTLLKNQAMSGLVSRAPASVVLLFFWKARTPECPIIYREGHEYWRSRLPKDEKQCLVWCHKWIYFLTSTIKLLDEDPGTSLNFKMTVAVVAVWKSNEV